MQIVACSICLHIQIMERCTSPLRNRYRCPAVHDDSGELSDMSLNRLPDVLKTLPAPSTAERLARKTQEDLFSASSQALLWLLLQPCL